jgi:hypothetical protein
LLKFKIRFQLISLYFADISTLAIWFKQWAHEVAEVRAKFLRQTSNRLILDLDLLSSLARQFYNLFIQILKKINEVKFGDKSNESRSSIKFGIRIGFGC